MAATIAIVGSVDPSRETELGLEHLDEAKAACEALGRALADAGCNIVVYSNDPQFIEGDIVRGYVGSGKARAGSIGVLVHKEQHATFPLYDAALFDVEVDPSSGWEVSFYRSLFRVDGVLLIGGGQSTVVAGLIALSIRTPVVAVSTFGGRAREVWKTIGGTRNDVTDAHYKEMGRGWTARAADALVAALLEQRELRKQREERERRAERNEGRRRTVSLIVGGIVLLGSLAAIPVVYGIDPGSTLSIAALLVAPPLAGLSGAIMRNALDEGTEWLKTAILGLSAGVIAALLFVASQLATSPDALSEKGVRTLVVFVLVVGFIAGVTFDAVFAKLRKQDVVDMSAFEPKG